MWLSAAIRGRWHSLFPADWGIGPGEVQKPGPVLWLSGGSFAFPDTRTGLLYCNGG